jgi:hypothetical protein
MQHDSGDWLVLIALWAIIIALYFYIGSCQVRKMLNRWARSQGYRINSTSSSPEYRFFGRTMCWVSYISVEFPNGKTHTGKAICGDTLWGLWIDKVHIEWDR